MWNFGIMERSAAAFDRLIWTGFLDRVALPGGRMQGLLTALQRGFKKWIGWKRLGVAASLLIIALAIRALVHTLKHVDRGVVLTRIFRGPILPWLRSA
jgi:uncharacterized membrane protein YczE